MNQGVRKEHPVSPTSCNMNLIELTIKWNQVFQWEVK